MSNDITARAGQNDDAFILWFEDQDRPQEIFSGYGAQEAAERRYRDMLGAWSCHLFRKVKPVIDKSGQDGGELTVFDKPCSECVHASQVVGGWICKRKLMAITPTMKVSYYPDRDASHGGLCFEPFTRQDKQDGGENWRDKYHILYGGIHAALTTAGSETNLPNGDIIEWEDRLAALTSQERGAVTDEMKHKAYAAFADAESKHLTTAECIDCALEAALSTPSAQEGT